jgi:hypothetical protein
MEAAPRTEEELREQAISQLKKKRDFRSHDEIQRETQRLRG